MEKMFCNILCFLDLSAVGCCFLFSFDAEVDVTGSEVTSVGHTSFIVEEGKVTILDNKDDQDSDSYSDTSSDSDDPTLYVALFVLFFLFKARNNFRRAFRHDNRPISFQLGHLSFLAGQILTLKTRAHEPKMALYIPKNSYGFRYFAGSRGREIC